MAVSFEQLPPELHLTVMHHFPDVPTLLASIAAIPQLRRLYLTQKHRILAAVVRNYFGENLSKALSLLNSAIHYPVNSTGSPRPLCLVDSSTSSAAMWPVDTLYLTTTNVKRLLDLDSRVDRLIRECVHLQFGIWIQLSSSESYSIRRGMYNFLHAATLSRKPANTENIQALTDFYLRLSTLEVLEVLYILHCLRDLARDHFRRLSEYLFDQIMEGFIVTDFQTQDQAFGTSTPQARQAGCTNAPWMLDLAHLNSLTAPIGELEFYRFDPEDVLASDDAWTRSAPFGHFDPMEDKLKEQVPSTQYDWTELAPNHANFEITPSPRGYGNIFRTIPTGFMIWNKDHWDQLCARQAISKGVDAKDYLQKRQRQREEDRTVLGRLMKWSWTVHCKDYSYPPGPRKYPRGEPSVLGPIRSSRDTDRQSAKDYRDPWPFVHEEARRRLREERDEFLKEGCDLPFKIDWKKGILIQIPIQDWATCESLGSW